MGDLVVSTIATANPRLESPKKFVGSSSSSALLLSSCGAYLLIQATGAAAMAGCAIAGAAIAGAATTAGAVL